MTQQRDRLGRPLRGSDNDPRAFPQVPERASLDGEAAWREALTYLADNLPFHVHEVCEQRWRCAPESEREVWRALAQWGAALTHQARGNPTGTTALAQRALDTWNTCDHIPEYINPEVVTQSLHGLLA
ncbi:MAG: DUF309 domain-containing protein [Candidatus Nanopelagicales bacterium]|nr:DUF309 domain-containing protein [Candidatus Nanopelagicales bacterium]MCF8538880.1 DUF309 domain-containing protein [Candidatus Nanopelagicales bacterium]MCF8551088.1 DUF309 domain-containing protein [Candidatus Nanopelagicales bacterium]